MKTLMSASVAVAALVLAQAASAQSLEEQLRTQLRDARSQVQELQGEQAAWKSQKAGLENERDQARKALEQAQAELARARGSNGAVAAEKSARQQAESALQQARHENSEVTAKLQEQQKLGGNLQTQLDEARQAIGTCSARNQRLYEVSQEILSAYEHVDMGTVIGARQPFAAAARVKLENAAQAYGDKLYEQRFVAPAGQQP
jgi:chromosome segregation ATPase